MRRNLVLASGLVMLAACGSQMEPPAPDATLTSPDASVLPASEVLVQPEEAPEGVTFDPSVSGSVPADVLGSELAAPGEAWPPDGFVEAFQHVFRMPAEEVPTDPDEVRGVINLMIAFEDGDAVLAFLNRSFPPSLALKEAIPFGYGSLGEERRGLRTKATQDRPVRTTLIWKRGRLFLQLKVFGDYSLEEVMIMANAVDARAQVEH
jgi:hypothetical protein